MSRLICVFAGRTSFCCFYINIHTLYIPSKTFKTVSLEKEERMDSRVTCTECFPVDSSIPFGFILTFSPIFSSPEQSSRRAIVLPPASALAFALALASASTVLRKVFKTSLFPNPLMDLVYIWYDDRYWSKILFSTIPTPMHDLKVKVTDLELLC